MRETTQLFSGTGGGEEVVRGPSRENRFGGLQLTCAEGSLGEVSCGAWLCPWSGRKDSFAHQWSRLTRDPKEAHCSCGRGFPWHHPVALGCPTASFPRAWKSQSRRLAHGRVSAACVPFCQEQTREQDEGI